MRNLRYVKCQGRFPNTKLGKELISISKKWMQLVIDYTDIASVDNSYCEPPYWHNERANVSLLANAAAKKGVICLEDYLASKRTVEDGRRNAQNYGRVDLKAYKFPKNKRLNFFIEAKQSWPTDGYKFSPDIPMKVAVKDVKRAAIDDPSLTGIACVFYTLRTKCDGSHVAGDVKKGCDALIAKITNYDILAISLPAKARSLCDEEDDGLCRFWPGVAMALKKVG